MNIIFFVLGFIIFIVALLAACTWEINRYEDAKFERLLKVIEFGIKNK